MTVDDFIAKWRSSGGNERANTQIFIADLCALLGVPAPGPAQPDNSRNDYVFERNVIKTEIDGTTSNGWIDCYRRDSFILEAKQGSDADLRAYESGEENTRRDFFGETAGDRYKRGMAKRGTPQWTGAMQRAASQAEGYAKALPADHGWPPFLLVGDIGYCIDVYADFQRSGKGYAPFPDRHRYRIELEDLRDETVRARLVAIWQNPLSLDPSTEAARVTREIAGLLAELAKRLDARIGDATRVADFLMRLLFTMFAEDTGLIPRDSFTELLKKLRHRPENLPPQLTALWQAMDAGGFAGMLGEAGEMLRQFNGYLFKDRSALDLQPAEIDILIEAAKADWRLVEPAIFGTLLERALNPRERSKLGAHYTPRAYVERLIGPTVMEPLRADWEGARTAATLAAEKGDRAAARKLVEAFHTRLAATRVLDPACGTGNFLYVAMARMKELEGEVLELLAALDDQRYLAELASHTVAPENFLGIEIVPRAAAIAQLVLWIGYLQWHFRVNGEDRMPAAPILRDIRTIENRDALIAWTARELERDAQGKPLGRWDGETMKPHPITGKPVPDETAQMEIYRYTDPKPAAWPEADFIVGNPPFIGGKDVRERLGEGYFDALFADSEVPESADFVMHWWDRAASLLRRRKIRSFGFVTTNSIRQAFSRRVMARHLDGRDPVGMIYAIPDHPWVSEKGDAAVRIAMTVAARGRQPEGRLLTVADESAAPDRILFVERRGSIHSDLTVGADVAGAPALRANDGIASPGMKLHGDGFIVDAAQAAALGLGRQPGVETVIHDYRNGRDLAARPRSVQVIDLYGLSEAEVETRFPAIYAHVRNTVFPHRAHNARDSYRLRWWIFGEARSELRKALRGLPRYIATVETAKHRVFQFLPASTVPDNMLVAIGDDRASTLGVLSSRIHVAWALAAGGTLEDRPRYNKSRCFDPFPFPVLDDAALAQRIGDSAEALDGLRKQVLAQHDDLTLTKLYNALEALRAAEAAGTVLEPKLRDVAERGCVSLIRQYHDRIDTAVAAAYGWPADLPEAEILLRLVALNAQRVAEEARGQVRWLRPAFQAPDYVAPAQQEAMPLAVAAAVAAEIVPWPKTLPEQVVAVAAAVGRSGRPVAAAEVARGFKGRNAKTVLPVLDALAGMGRLRKLEDGRYAA